MHIRFLAPASAMLLGAAASGILLAGNALGQTGSGVFTLWIGGQPAPPISLVQPADSWRYHPGTNAPQTGWMTLSDAALDATWGTGPAGFGYEDGDDVTVLSNMLNHYTTVYVRRSFDIAEPIDAGRTLELVMDYDDGFIAWLDGQEIARSGNAPGAVGSIPAYTATSRAGQNHEALLYQGLPAEVYGAGSVGGRLNPGTHVLAVLGLNSATNSGDFSLIPALRVTGNASAANGEYFSRVTTNSVQLSGSNTFAGSARVTVNGYDAAFDPASGTWSRTHPLQPGMNRLFIAALDASGAILASTNRDIVAELNTVTVGGILPGNATWTAAGGVVRVTNLLVVPPGAALTVQSNVVVLLSPGAGIQVSTNSTLEVAGAWDAPVFFLPADGTSLWQELLAVGAGASLALRHSETVAGRVRALNGGAVLVEDSILRDFPSATREIVAGVSGAQLTLRRTHLARYSEIDSRNTPFLAEDCLVEQPNVDGMDIKGTMEPLVVRRTTLRFGSGDNTDAIDLGPSLNTTIENCLARQWPDKGVSVGAGSVDAIVRGSLFYNVGKGVEVADSASAYLINNTVAASSNGFHLYEKTAGEGGGHAIAMNNVLWGNTQAVALANGSTIALTYSDVQGGWPGEGNRDADPLFVDAGRHDYRLGPGSPALGTGQNGTDMGAVFPVGGIPAKPLALAALIQPSFPIELAWEDDSDNEDRFLIQRSTDGTVWQPLGAVGANTTRYTDSSAAFNQLYFYRVCATNFSGLSRWSNPASAVRPEPHLVVGGRLTTNTVWSPDSGQILVRSNVLVPTNVTLTILAGTVVRLTNNASIVASTGGVVRIEGAWDRPVILRRWNGTNNWAELKAQGAGASLFVRFADISGGQTTVYYGANALLEDTLFHDFIQQGAGTTFNQPLVLMHFAAPSVVRRCHFRDYYETLWRNGVFLIEDCLFEDMAGDALDFDAAQPGTALRRTLFRHGFRGNVDAVDVGPADLGGSRDIVIEDCHMYDFPFDKGVSIGEGCDGITVRNCLIHHAARGIQVKDTCTAILHNNTIFACEIGLHGYQKSTAYPGGGWITNAYNNILWAVTNAVVLETNSIFVLHHSDTGGTNWPGTGNFSEDPQFENAAAWDFRLKPGSPCRGSGQDGADMGVTYPVGAYIEAPSHLTATAGVGAVLLTWRDNSPSEAVYAVERSTNGAPFITLAYVSDGSARFLDVSGAPETGSVYRVRGLNLATQSVYSVEAPAQPGLPPRIVLQPADALAAPGETLAMSVTAEGVAPLAYLWLRNGAPAATPGGPTLAFPSVALGDAGLYSVVVSDAIGLSTTSAVARLTVTEPPSLSLGANGAGVNQAGLFTLQFTGPPEVRHVIEATTDFQQWIPLGTNSTGDGLIEFSDPGSTNFVRRFYRARLLP